MSGTPRPRRERIARGVAWGAAGAVALLWIAGAVLGALSQRLVPFEPLDEAAVAVNRAQFDPAEWDDPVERRREAIAVHGTAHDVPIDYVLPDEERIVRDPHVGDPPLYRVEKAKGDQPLQWQTVRFLRNAGSLALGALALVAAGLAAWWARSRQRQSQGPSSRLQAS